MKGVSFLKFIFPQNYNFKNKLFGIIDYTTILVNFIWSTFVFLFVFLLFKDWSFRIFLLITFSFPLLLLSIVGFQGENIFYVLSYLFKFIFGQKLFFYRKNNF